FTEAPPSAGLPSPWSSPPPRGGTRGGPSPHGPYANHQRSAIFRPSHSQLAAILPCASFLAAASTSLLKTRTMTPPSAWISCCSPGYMPLRLFSSVSPRAATSNSLKRGLAHFVSFQDAPLA